MNRLYVFFALMFVLVGCNGKHKQEQQAQLRVSNARELVVAGNLNAAKLQLDSVHLLYPRQVAQRREAKNLMDSIVYLEAKRNLQYADSLLMPLLEEVDALVKQFNYEKNTDYENSGRYVNRLLPTNRNIARCFIQAYVSDDVKTTLKSYYYGKNSINHQSLTLSIGEDMLTFSGSLHSFSDDGAKYEILTFSDDDALTALSFIANHVADRIKVTLKGESEYTYYLNQNEKQALQQTCLLAVKMRDAKQLEQQINVANAQIAKYENKQN